MRTKILALVLRAEHALLALLCASVAGCSLPPSIPVMGAYFPGWLFCMTGGLVLTLLVRAMLVHAGKPRVLGPPVILYSALYALFSLLFWLIFF
ncbi:YtcA family lipoprotein [Dyella telluris]|uniref:Uncharacterized protein YtcA n=1 Tax=Dyella telluris TaxID=2763498 RepID=A0A7G8Q4T8_9GAMM|nr:YtcA family lipoprotein [Dyella telluris]QNK01796.1 hypothetical protein H8F01_01050 [Dyella telluris]